MSTLTRIVLTGFEVHVTPLAELGITPGKCHYCHDNQAEFAVSCRKHADGRLTALPAGDYCERCVAVVVF